MSDRDPTELYEILERFGTVLDGNDLSDLSRMCREYAVNVHETRLGPALAEQRMATDSWHKKFNDLNEESLRLFREVERLTAELESRAAPVEPPVLSAVVNLVNEQAEDECLWFEAQTMPEAYLQQELRRLHEVIENSAPVPAPRLEWRNISKKNSWSPRWEAVDRTVFLVCGPLKGGTHEGEFNLAVGGSVALRFFPTIDAAKSLAEKLNAVLSPPVGENE